jgi:hypothetical protein
MVLIAGPLPSWSLGGGEGGVKGTSKTIDICAGAKSQNVKALLIYVLNL